MEVQKPTMNLRVDLDNAELSYEWVIGGKPQGPVSIKGPTQYVEPIFYRLRDRGYPVGELDIREETF